MIEKFGIDYKCDNEDCVGHVQKRVGAPLPNFKSNCRDAKLSDSKTVGGMRSLTGKRIDQIQTYYGCAIRNNDGVRNISCAIWAIYFHTICGPLEESFETQHSYYPDGPNTWCKYKQDIINGTNKYYREKCLPPVFRSELRRCSKGLTQDQNEALNNVVWSKRSKRVFTGRERFKLAVCEAITPYKVIYIYI